MNKKRIEIFFCMLFLVISALSVSGTKLNIKIHEESDPIDFNLSEYVMSGKRLMSYWSEQKIIALDGVADDSFGCCVSINGNYAIIGAPHNDDNGEHSGSAYIFKNDGTNWIEEQKLTASDSAESDLFGYYVSISGDYVIIGAPYDDDNGEMSGSAYIFKNTGSLWIEEQKLTASDGAESDLFGFVSINGEYAIIGAPYDDDTGSNTGSVYIFKKDGTSWIEEQKLHASDTTTSIGFGVSVSINEEYAIIGAPYKDDFGLNSGSVYVFNNNGGSWVEEQKLTASDGAADDFFGRCVSMDGGYIAISAPKDDDIGVNSGSVYVFKNDGSSWKEEQKLTALDAATDDYFGSSVSIDNNYIIIGAENNDDVVEDSGSAYIFKRDGMSWIEETKLLASDSETEDFFGESVSICGNYAIVGSGLDDNSNGINAGCAYIFKRSNQPPKTPSIKGPNSGKPGEELCWTFHSNDPDGNEIMFFIDWGDGTNELTECVESCTNLTACHTYSEKLTYIIRVKAIECVPDGLESDWGEFKIKISRYRNSIRFSSYLLRFFYLFQYYKDHYKI